MFHPKVTKVQKVKVSESDTMPPPQKITKEQGWKWNVTGDRPSKLHFQEILG